MKHMIASLIVGLASAAFAAEPVQVVPSAAAEQPKPYPTLNPPPGITPVMTREPYIWSYPYHRIANPNPTNAPSMLPRRTWTQVERKQYEQRVKWFHDAKYGIFFHFLAHGQGWTPEEWNEWVNAVDVEKVAEQAKAIGAGYVGLTIGQVQKFSCDPNPVIDKYWGDQYTATRDLPMDLWAALHKRGIPMILYVAMDQQFRMPTPRALKGKARFERWLEVMQWYSDHYGTKCKGWWVDGLFAEYIQDYRVNAHKVLKHGNPDSLVASGQYEISDFLHGHCMPNWSRQSAVVKPFFGRWDPDYNIQWHVFQYIGRDWAAPGCSKTTAELVKYATDVVKGGGVFTFDIGTFTQTWHNKSGRTPDGKRIGPYLEIPPDQFKQLEAVRDALKDIPVSDGSGK